MGFDTYFTNLRRRSATLSYFGFLLLSGFAAVTSGQQSSGDNDAAGGDGVRCSIDISTFCDSNQLTHGFDCQTCPDDPFQFMLNLPSQECVRSSEEALRKLCPNLKDGLMMCIDPDISCGESPVNRTLNITVDIHVFNTTFCLVTHMSQKPNLPAENGAAAGSHNYYCTAPINCPVQCWKDASTKDCSICLVKPTPTVEISCASEGGEIFTLQYEIYLCSKGGGSPPPYVTPTDEDNNTISSDTPTIHNYEKSSKNTRILFGVVGSSVILLSLICLFGLRNKVKSAICRRTGTLNEEIEICEDASHLGLVREENFIFSLESLKQATGDFDDNSKLGEGGFGTVYKGTTKDGKDIAVKMVSAKSKQRKKEFKNEVQLLANVQHKNIVNLVGCCAKGNKRFLIYEYLPNKSLDFFLFSSVSEKRKILDWQKRYNIITGIACGLRYLHEHSVMRIIHRDIKASNILLDENLDPKIADFGLATLFPEDEIFVQTKAAGTYGYMAPEYAMGGHLSVKADVYSFGVLLLEIVSGRKHTDMNLPWEMQSSLEWAWRRMYDGGDVLSMVDSALIEYCCEEEMQKQAFTCIHVGLLCIQADATLRPSMSDVVTMITKPFKEVLCVHLLPKSQET